MQGKELSGEGGVEEGMGGAEEEADKGQEEGEVNGRKERIGGNERGKKVSVRRKFTASVGCVHKSIGERSVGVAGHRKRWRVVWRPKRHSGQIAEEERPICTL